VTGSTVGQSDDFTPSCAAPGSPDRSFLFTAPESATYVADTVGSEFDTVLHVYDPTFCDELACDDDGGGYLQSRLMGFLDEGQQVLIVVDGFGGAAGMFELNLDFGPPPPPCPEIELESQQPQWVEGETSGPSHLSGSCGGSSAPERTYTFTAPMAGTYSFFTESASYDTVLYLRDGSCDGQELGCDDDGGSGLHSLVQLPLEDGQTVVIVVDGFGQSFGTFTLYIFGA